MIKTILLFCAVALLAALPMKAQSLGNAGTIEGTVTDPMGASVPNARVTVSNSVSGYMQTVTTAMDGSFRISNIPPNPYHLEITAAGFAVSAQDVTIRNAIPIQLSQKLALAGSQTTVSVEAAGDILENDPSAHVDVDRSLILKIPAVDAAGGLSQAIIYSTGGVAADGNGFFHPLGDHAQAATGDFLGERDPQQRVPSWLQY